MLKARKYYPFKCKTLLYYCIRYMIEKNATFYKTDEIHGKVFTDILIVG